MGDSAWLRLSVPGGSVSPTPVAQYGVTRPMLGFTPFEAAQGTLVGIERMHRLKEGQLPVAEGAKGLTPAEWFYALAA
jgi:hypothetical protein